MSFAFGDSAPAPEGRAGRWALLALAPLVSVLCVAACADRELPPEGQLVLYVDTNAPLPAPPGATLGPDDPPPLFDRLRIEVFAPGSTVPCNGCTHDFDLDGALVRARRASVGLTLPTGQEGWRAHVRMSFGGIVTAFGDVHPDTVVEQTIALPPTPSEGIVPVTVLLRVEDLAHARGRLDAPLPAEIRTPEGLAGTWPPAQRVPCTLPAQPGEVCVPGGATWAQTISLNGLASPRITVLSPFFYDATEMTVAAMRASKQAIPNDPMPFNASDGQPGPVLHCTYTVEPGNDEVLPVNCVSWALARRVCQQRGADLPTRAQFQYATSALVGNLFPWGNDLPACGDAVYARSNVNDPDRRCLGGWVEPPGAGARDRLALPGGEIVDLAGNVAEYVLDTFAADIPACYAPGVVVDPVCLEPSRHPSLVDSRVVVGGSWVSPFGGVGSQLAQPSISFEKARKQGPAGGLDAFILTSTGFRCARPGR